jgi:hypothetical protein
VGKLSSPRREKAASKPWPCHAAAHGSKVVEVIALEERDHAPHFAERTGHRRKQHDEWQCGLASAPSGDASARGSCIDTGGVAHV